MATMESMLRNINRQLEQHKRLFGKDSATYKDFVLTIERIMGKANYTQKNGAVGYSRAIPMQYKYEDVQKANEAVKGKNTAAVKWSKLYDEAKQYEIPDKDITTYNRIKEEVDKNNQAIYNYLKEEILGAFYSSDFAKGYHDSFLSDKSSMNHIMQTTEYNTLESIDNLLKRVKARQNAMNSEIEREAKKTKGGRVTKKEADQLKNRFNRKWKK